MRALLVVPPFGSLDRPSLGVHTLQAFARREGHTVDVFYSNMLFAARVGEIAYMLITTFGIMELLGERLMGSPVGAILPDRMLDELNLQIRHASAVRGMAADSVDRESLCQAIDDWLDQAGAFIRAGAYDVIGFSTTFEQTNAVALLARTCRRLLPAIPLIVGGANCEGPMAPAMMRLIPEIDVVFSGESEIAFTRYLGDADFLAGRKIVESAPNADLNDAPPLDYSDFFRDLGRWLPNSILRQAGDLRLPYESSRGCWWGQKHHCTFCGLNGGGIGYREKAPEKVVAELAVLASETGVTRIEMTDNIMPHSYFGTLIPLLAEADLGLDIFYEQKANMSLEKLLSLQAAGVNGVQPGIEALSDDLLRLMRKGTSTRQNVAVLRYGRSISVDMTWNILSGFPGEREEWYAETLRLLPLLSHLQPPTGFYTLNFDRFSPYFENAALFGIRNLAPAAAYAEAFPNCDCLPDLAYHFRGDSTGLSVDGSEVLQGVKGVIETWRRRWGKPEQGMTPPCLEVVDIGGGAYLLLDTRGLPGGQRMQQITERQASVALSFHSSESAATRWGEKHGVCFRLDGGGYLPLACAAPKILHRFESVRLPDLEDAPV